MEGAELIGNELARFLNRNGYFLGTGFKSGWKSELSYELFTDYLGSHLWIVVSPNGEIKANFGDLHRMQTIIHDPDSFEIILTFINRVAPGLRRSK